jgi:hypothetical protein
MPRLNDDDMCAAARLITYAPVTCADCAVTEPAHFAHCRYANPVGKHSELHNTVVDAVVAWASRCGLPATRVPSSSGFAHIPDLELRTLRGPQFIEVKTGWCMRSLRAEVQRGVRQYDGGERPWLLTITE